MTWAEREWKTAQKRPPQKKYLSLQCLWEALNRVILMFYPRTRQNYSPCRRTDQREPVMYFSVASISSTDGLKWSLLERIKEISSPAMCMKFGMLHKYRMPSLHFKAQRIILSLTNEGVERNWLEIHSTVFLGRIRFWTFKTRVATNV